MKQHLGRQSGVQSVEVSLVDGKVEITPKEDARIDPAQLLKAVYDSGVSVAEMVVAVRGKVVKDASGNVAIQVEPDQSSLSHRMSSRRNLNQSPAHKQWTPFVGSFTRKQQAKRNSTLRYR